MNTSSLAAIVTLTLICAACSSSSSSPSGGTGDPDAASPSGGSSGSSSGSSGGSSSGSSSGSSTGSNGGSSSGSSSGSNGGSSSGSGSGGGSDAGSTPANDATLVLDVPSTFTGTTRELDVVVTPTVPVAGPPAGILYQVMNPVVTAGQSLTIHGDATGIKGSDYVVVVLYMQGGGQFAPKSGVDYEAQTASAMTFTGGPIDLGTLTLALAP